MKMKYAFTLVEILIVIVVMGILAAIVIPQFSTASTQARESYLMESLEDLRAKIELYQIQHNGLLPGEEGRNPSSITKQTNSQRLIAALCGKTNEFGQLGTTRDHRFGPYLVNVPANPFCTRNADRIEVDGRIGNGDYGWHLTTQGKDRGVLVPDDAGVNTFSNQPHTSY